MINNNAHLHDVFYVKRSLRGLVLTLWKWPEYFLKRGYNLAHIDHMWVLTLAIFGSRKVPIWCSCCKSESRSHTNSLLFREVV